ncbi:hypothetical protein [Marinobacter sp.]|uniref:hypothetical protein n=1 Tax=Marinobacter sp. TaxID=50741 RepID=UPI002B47A826|nr:hypothetical protein [Marinobacter sp.]HKK57344.1 hypothetical protein [Marinobacter sp.]
MATQGSRSQRLLELIDQEFKSIVGPIGELLIEDARKLGRRKGWKGPSAPRHYISALAANIDSERDREAFLDATSKVVYSFTSGSGTNLPRR